MVSDKVLIFKGLKKSQLFSDKDLVIQVLRWMWTQIQQVFPTEPLDCSIIAQVDRVEHDENLLRVEFTRRSVAKKVFKSVKELSLKNHGVRVRRLTKKELATEPERGEVAAAVWSDLLGTYVKPAKECYTHPDNKTKELKVRYYNYKARFHSRPDAKLLTLPQFAMMSDVDYVFPWHFSLANAEPTEVIFHVVDDSNGQPVFSASLQAIDFMNTYRVARIHDIDCSLIRYPADDADLRGIFFRLHASLLKPVRVIWDDVAGFGIISVVLGGKSEVIDFAFSEEERRLRLKDYSQYEAEENEPEQDTEHDKKEDGQGKQEGLFSRVIATISLTFGDNVSSRLEQLSTKKQQSMKKQLTALKTATDKAKPSQESVPTNPSQESVSANPVRTRLPMDPISDAMRKAAQDLNDIVTKAQMEGESD